MALNATDMPINIRTLNYKETIEKFTQDRGQDLVKVAKLEGGWEGWAQVEIAVTRDDTKRGVLRELDVFTTTTKSKVDFAFSYPLTFMELKCKIKSESPRDFAIRLVKDVKKFEATDPLYKSLVVGVVGLYPPKANGDYDGTTEQGIRGALGEAWVGDFDNRYVKTPIEFYHSRGGFNIGICWWSGLIG